MPNDHLRKGPVSLAHQTYFITTVTHRRQPWFRDWKIGRLVCRAMQDSAQAGMIESHAWVIMPDHLHWLLTLRSDTSLPAMMKRFKATSAQQINRRLGRHGPVWQKAYFDHALRREEDLRAIARQMVANPLRAGLVQHIGEYPLWDAAWL